MLTPDFQNFRRRRNKSGKGGDFRRCSWSLFLLFLFIKKLFYYIYLLYKYFIYLLSKFDTKKLLQETSIEILIIYVSNKRKNYKIDLNMENYERD